MDTVTEAFDENEYFGYILKGHLVEAIAYTKRFPEQAALYQRYMVIFDKEQFLTYEIDESLNDILRTYQQHYF